MRAGILGLMAVLCSVALYGQTGLVTNGGFSTTQGKPPWPVKWDADKTAGQRFEVVNVDGYGSNDSLLIHGEQGVRTATVKQQVAVQKNTEYVLTAALKGVRSCRPVVRVLNAASGDALTELKADDSGRWQRQTTRFNSGDAATLTLQISADADSGEGAVDAIALYEEEQAPGELLAGDWFTPPGANIARGKSYTLQPRPNYSYCTDGNDDTQLTDGAYTAGYFWTQKSTVGWTRANPVIITLDLGAVQPISGASLNTAAGVAGVTWPFTILVLVSDDGNSWYQAGELVRATLRQVSPPEEKYGVQRFAAKGWETKGRFVKFMVGQTPYCFVDEVEVYEGDPQFLSMAHKGEAFAGGKALTEQLFVRPQITAALDWRLRQDLGTVTEALEAQQDQQQHKQAVQQALSKAEELVGRINSLPEAPVDLRTILPVNDLHREILALNAVALRARGYRGVTAWKANRWERLDITQAPEAPPEEIPGLEIPMMREEVRADTVNLTNATDQDVTVDLALSGLPEALPKDRVSVRDVLFTDTRSRVPIAAALPAAQQTEQGWRVSIPAGTTKQIWVSFQPPTTMAGGTYEFALETAGSGDAGTLTIPVTLRLYAFDYPDDPTLALGGWDYTNGSASYYRAPGNLESLLRLFRDYDVNTPWATRSVAPTGMHFDEAGRLENPGALNLTAWNEWVERWSFARNYFVFLSVGETFEGEKMGSERFNRMVGDWFKAWAAHVREQGIAPQRIGVLLVDEPHRHEQDEIIIAWARAIRAADTGIQIFEDPTYRDPTEGLPEMFELCDILCPNTPMMMNQGQAFRDFYLAQQEAGRTLWLYSCSGPAKKLDPCGYHRGQMWWAARLGATGCFYWALGCGGRIGDSWRAYAQSGVEYSPFFVGQQEVTHGKHMEAVREGVQDYEYFVMLRERVNAMKRRGRNAQAVRQAERLLTEGPLRVTEAVDEGGISWSDEVDHHIMDEVRVSVLEALARLEQP